MKGSQAGVMGTVGNPCGLSQLLVSWLRKKAAQRQQTKRCKTGSSRAHDALFTFLGMLGDRSGMIRLILQNDATDINNCTMRPAEKAGTGAKFQHNWVVSGFMN